MSKKTKNKFKKSKQKQGIPFETEYLNNRENEINTVFRWRRKILIRKFTTKNINTYSRIFRYIRNALIKRFQCNCFPILHEISSETQ